MSQSLKKALQTYQQGDFASSLTLTKKAIASDRVRTQEVFALLGNTFLKLGNRLEAADAFSQAAGFQSANTGLLAKLAVNLYQALGARDRILQIGEKAVRLNGGDAEIAFAYASALFADGRFQLVAPYLDSLDRNNVQHLVLIINYHRLSGHFELLSRELDEACRADPSNTFLRISRYVVAREVCDFAALKEYEAIMRTPDTPEAAALLAGEPAHARIYWSDSEDLNRRPSINAGKLAQFPASPVRRRFSGPEEKIRIGYLSNDFYDHATMRLFRRVLTLHDRNRFDITLFCYSDAHHVAWQQLNFPPVVRDAIVPVRDLNEKAAAELIAAHRIDILVDLKGHSMGSRLGIVNLSDAPVKVTYLGFPGSVTGADLDYTVTDRIVTPDSSRPFYHEKLCRLPESYQANDAESRPLPQPSSRDVWDLPADTFVFASFNATQKFNPRTHRLWCRILKAVPEAVFWLMCEKPVARQNLLAAFAAEGIAPERIIFTGLTDYPAHLARIPLADLGLDTFPCNGHTTTSDMLWAGLPVLSSRGSSFTSRVSESLLNAIGLPELVAEDDDAFCALAVELAGHPARIEDLKTRLVANRFAAPLFDAGRLTAHLENGYEMMAARARDGLGPDHIDVPAMPARLGTFDPSSTPR